MLPLESCKLFHALPAADLAALKAVAEQVAFEPDEEIFKEGDSGDALYVIHSGTVHISTVLPNGDRHVLAQLHAGDAFGEMAIVDQQPRSACALASTATTVCRIPREALLSLIERSPRFSIALMREITQRLREFNRQYTRAILQAERMAVIGRFASSIVHDLKNPLTIISVAADTACQPNSTAESRQVAQRRIRRQVDRISTMVSDILDFTRGGQASLPLALLDYAEYLTPILDEIAQELEPKGITIRCLDVPPSLKVAINPRRLNRVFYNLIFNAADAMPEGGEVRLRFRVEGSELVTEVADTGSGIVPEMLDKLFEAFTTHGKARGTGLGLSIARQIVSEHHGRIYARNVEGSGALFGFTLPVAPQHSSLSPQ